MNKPLSYAENILLLANKIGFTGLNIYALSRVNIDEIESYLSDFEDTGITEGNGGDEISGEFEALASGCWFGQEYAAMLMNDESDLKLNEFDQIFKITSTNLNSFPFDELYGLYYVSFEGQESHYFTLLVMDEYVYYDGTYGGVCEFILNKYDKSEYFRAFVEGMNGDLEKYLQVFGNPEEFYIDQVEFHQLTFMKSNNYN